MGGSIHILPITPLSLEHLHADIQRSNNLIHRLPHTLRHVTATTDQNLRALLNESAQLTPIRTNPVLHIAVVAGAGKGSTEAGQPPILQITLKLRAVQKVDVRMAPAPIEIHGAVQPVVPNESCQWSNAGARTHQDHRRPAGSRSEVRIGSDEGVDAIPRLQAVKIAGAQPSRLPAHADFQGAVRDGRGQGIEPGYAAARRSNAYQVANLEVRQPASPKCAE